MKRQAFFVALLGVSIYISACGKDQEINFPEDDNPLDSSGKSIEVFYDGNSSTVSLDKLPTVSFNGAPHVKLSDVLAAAIPKKPIAQLQISDFVASDGFSPRQKSNCDDLLPVVGATIEQGYIEPVTRNLKWDNTDYPGCMSGRDIIEIYVQETGGNTPSKSIETIYTNTISWEQFDTELIDSVAYVKLSDVLEAAFPGKQLQVVDFIGPDGFSPNSSENCNGLLPVVGATIEQGYINPLNGNLRWDASLAYPGCMRVNGVAEIWVEVEN
ncbi:MAG: hypothetical protein FWD46_00355 [Cystobacterineae bacterium]|nr:hypothetical protein [Cystobacterineae bacterium]